MNSKFLTVFVSLIVFQSYVFSQKLKYGYINADKVLMEMPEIELANKEIEGYVAQINDYINSKTDDYKKKLADFQKNEASLTEIIRQDRQNEINKLGNDIKIFQQNAQNEINKKKNDLYQSAIVKLKAAISSVAKENGYRFIIDNSTGQLLYAEEGDNVENLVRKKLGIPEK